MTITSGFFIEQICILCDPSCRGSDRKLLLIRVEIPALAAGRWVCGRGMSWSFDLENATNSGEISSARWC